jgi:transcription-repair coupling factor (superfamily II helicase)
LGRRSVLKTLESETPNPTVNRDAFSLSLKIKVELQDLRKNLVALAYENMNISPVSAPGQFSIRGGLVDIWLERYKDPVRIDFFGDRVEAIYLFDPLVHERLRNLDEIVVTRYSFSSTAKVRWPKEAQEKLEKLMLSDIKPGDLVVHVDHGIGRFLRISEKNLEGLARYYLIIEYAKGEKLYVPVGHIDRLAKYIGVHGHRPKLSFLGTNAWEKTKKKISRDLMDVARELLKLYAERHGRKRQPYLPETPWSTQLAQNFKFELTSSQQRAWEDIRSDLESTSPMDRLLVGDVGFGKTELALRAAFKVVQSGYQVVFLAPTSILAEQHYELFRSRLRNFAVNVTRLSRFTERKEAEAVFRDLANGSADIVVGTHRVLGKDVRFFRLGIAIVDEEHRFGVIHKEKLKQLKSDVDVLTLSATPIPRTLHLALTKLRDLSVVSDPPSGRMAVRNFIGPYNSEVVKRAIGEEVKRFGQAFYLSNRVQTIQAEAKRVRELVPNARVAVAHGQMGDEALGATMRDFIEKKIDVLVCSTIIGSGLDIPNVNTIIIKDSQRLGLADLYQLRGRVGRGKIQAQAYFFYPKGYKLGGQSRDRLEALSEAEELGSGLNLAERDLEIRGAGNLLGIEQHGNVSLVGFELYLKLLGQAVKRLQDAD